MTIKLASTGLIVYDSKETLLIRHKKYGKWMAPGGKVDPGELVYQACIREIKEETGLDVSEYNRFNTVEFHERGIILPEPDKIVAYRDEDGNIDMEDNIYLIQLAAADRIKPLDKGEYTGENIGWFNINDIVEGNIGEVDALVANYLYLLTYVQRFNMPQPDPSFYFKWRNGDWI